ncbi:uncharacterized protein LOC110035286 [Phalaenopsis equestris]|uniref:uncharacterized protein LOC110035286 n=1 Tax=Phalaenopsis equestris TaxID=78828 RepID=UPI0009E65670|nr:uncharacterized protein LOC110035286 [Phalaenopsis equestris]
MWGKVDRAIRRMKEKQSSASVRSEAAMETTKPSPATRLGSLTRTVTKIFRHRRTATFSGVFDEESYNQKLKSNLSGFIDSRISTDCNPKEKPKLDESASSSSSGNNRNELELQVAESPYDPDTIQASDQAVVSELKHLSMLKQSYLKSPKQLETLSSPADSQILVPQLQEQRNLLKTYEITIRKLESSLYSRDVEIKLLQTRLQDSTRFNRSLESKLRPGRTLSIDNLHQSLPDPKHFFAVLCSAVKSIRNFVEQMMREMDSAGWDLDTAAGVIQPVVRGKSAHWAHAFQSFVSRCIFSDFRHPDFGVSFDGRRSSLDRRRFFQEFLELSSGKLVEAGGGTELEKLIRTKYLFLVHPRMEVSFFGNLDQRAAISTGGAFPDTEFFALFAEMAKRVWLLHCLFFSYGPEVDATIFQVKRGCRFSEVYMESVTASPANFPTASPAGCTVAFTVVPGFRVGKTSIQCEVYVSEEGKRNGGSR